jgi:hypothetical protein
MSKRIFAVIAGAAFAIGVAGCGERPQVVQYKQGEYQGKKDQKAWDGAPFNGNQTEWERVIKTRNQNQNEYKKTT